MRLKYQMGKRASAEGASIGMTAAPEEINYAHAARRDRQFGLISL